LAASISSGATQADFINQVTSVSINGGQTALSSTVFDPFDPSLGTLNQAIFTAQLNLFYTANTLPVQYPSGPAPTTIMGTTSISFNGLDWPFNSQLDCITQRGGVSGTALHVPVELNFSFRSTALSNAMGFTVGTGAVNGAPCAPNVINPVTLDDYIASPITTSVGLLTDIRSLWTVSSTYGAVYSTSGGGMLQLQYDYTPFETTNDIPEPTSAVLLGLGLASIGFARRKRKA
jgi:hypothetical protein